MRSLRAAFPVALALMVSGAPQAQAGTKAFLKKHTAAVIVGVSVLGAGASVGAGIGYAAHELSELPGDLRLAHQDFLALSAVSAKLPAMAEHADTALVHLDGAVVRLGPALDATTAALKSVPPFMKEASGALNAMDRDALLAGGTLYTLNRTLPGTMRNLNTTLVKAGNAAGAAGRLATDAAHLTRAINPKDVAGLIANSNALTGAVRQNGAFSIMFNGVPETRQR